MFRQCLDRARHDKWKACARLFTATFLASSLLGAPLAAQAAGFRDANNTVYGPAAIDLQSIGAITGYPDGTLRPYSPLSRAEALKIILAAQKQYSVQVAITRLAMPALPLFDDVGQNQWYAPFLEVAHKNRIVTGYPDNAFRPTASVNTQEAIALIVRGFGIATVGEYQQSARIQNMPSQWFTGAVNAAVTYDFVRPGATLKLSTPINRGEFIAMVAGARRLKLILGTGSSQGTMSSEPWGGGAANLDPAQVLQYASDKPFSISIPTLEIKDLGVSHPKDPFSSEGVMVPLETGVGHLFSYPGQKSKVMVYGHSSGFPWDISEFTKIFRKINKMKVGDRVYVTYNDRLYVYEVSKKQTVKADDTAAFEPDDKGEELILYTCWPPDSITQRYLVHAVPVGSVALH